MTQLKRCWNPLCVNGACDGIHHTGMAGEHWDESLTADKAPIAMPNGTLVLATVKYRGDTRRDWQIINPALRMPHPDVLLPLESLTRWLIQESQPAGLYQLWSADGLEVEGRWHDELSDFVTPEDQADRDDEREAEEAAMAELDHQIALAEEQSDSIEYGLNA